MNKAYPQFAHKFHMTGNPRADLWRPDFAPVFDVELPVKKPYVLFVSNLGSIFGESQLSELISALRTGYFDGPDDEREFFFYRHFAHGALLGAEYIRAIRRMAMEFPDTTIVVRPHPVEKPSVWRTLIGDYPNVVVSNEGSVNAWLRKALTIVHNGCTTAFEAAKSGTPVLTYTAVEGYDEDFYFPNRLGTHVKTLDDLLLKVRGLLEGGISTQRDKDLAVLSERLADTGDQTSADRQIAVWEDLAKQSGQVSGRFWRANKLPVLKSPESFYDVYRYARHVPLKVLGGKRIPNYPAKFETLTDGELDQLKERFARYNPAFGNLRVKRIAPRICSIEA